MHVTVDGVAPVAVRLLGALEVRGAGVALGARQLGGGKPRQVFEILVLHAGTAVPKARLVELLWPHRAPAEALPTLESYVSVLRNHLRAVCGSRTGLVRTAVGGYVVDRSSVRVDADLTTLVRQAATASPVTADRLLREVLDLADATLLADELDAPWAEEEREAHRLRLTPVLVEAAETATALGLGRLAVRLADRALLGEPHSELGWAVKIGALHAAGLQADALRAYATCREVLAADLGCAPGSLVQDAFRRVLTGPRDLDDDLGHLVAALVQVHDAVDGLGGGLAERLGLGPAVGSLPPAEACRLLADLVHRARDAARPLSLVR